MTVPIDNISAEDLKVDKKPVSAENKVDSKEFMDGLISELAKGSIWRTSKALSAKFNVDAQELNKVISTKTEIASRPSKEEGVFLYALVERLCKEEDKKVLQRPLVTEEDRYALAGFHSALMLLESVLQKNALKIHEKNHEAFVKFSRSKNELEAAILLYANTLKADLNKLPKVSN